VPFHAIVALVPGPTILRRSTLLLGRQNTRRLVRVRVRMRVRGRVRWLAKESEKDGNGVFYQMVLSVEWWMMDR
jgi:hypothetical protein